jgi:hypothetical protein
MDEDEQLVADCEARESRLTDWQRSFIDSIRKRIDDGKGLTERQREVLNDIWDRATTKG